MIHIIGLRKGESNPQKIFGIMGESIERLFANLPNVVEKIPPEERFNCYYTCFHPLNLDDPRSFSHQTVIPLDIDHVPEEQLTKVTECVSECLKIPVTSMVVVFSGHGVQFLIKSPFVIDDINYFKNMRTYYKNMAAFIQSHLKRNNLCGEVDTAVWSPSRLMRLPMTINRKEGLPDSNARLINGTLEDVPFDLTIFKPEVEDIKRIQVRTTVQTEGVLKCPFLNWCNDNQLEVSEPQWHAMIGVLAWIPEKGGEFCHTYSSQHPKYSPKEVDDYIDRAIKLTGPRTCNSISQCWDGCASCEYRNGKGVNTPLCIKTEDYISSRDTGFHNLVVDAKGKESLVPDFEGLTKFFKQEYNFIVHPVSKIVYIWREKDFSLFNQIYKGGMWHAILDNQIEMFAHEHFKPFVKDKTRQEFLKLVLISNHIRADFFDAVVGHLNFNNGILNTRTGELIPHDKSYGFTYKLDFDYDANATCPRFDRFLDEITDTDSGKALMEFVGITAASELNSSFEKALMLSGNGANGKSVFMFLLRYLLGDSNCVTVNMRDMATAEGRYLLYNKLVNIVAEENSKALLNNTDMFKAVVTGESVTGKILYKNSFSFKPNAKLIYSFNELPITDDLSRGFFRRCMIIDFPNSFEGKEDRELLQTLKNEAAGVWNRIIEAYRRVKDSGNKMTISAKMQDESEEYREISDNVLRFYEEFIITLPLDSNESVPMRIVYELYSHETAKDNQKPVSLMKFSKRLAMLVGKKNLTRRFQKDGTRLSVVQNIKIKTGGNF